MINQEINLKRFKEKIICVEGVLYFESSAFIRNTKSTVAGGAALHFSMLVLPSGSCLLVIPGDFEE